MGREWTDQDHLLICKAAELYEQQWTLIRLCEYPSRTQQALSKHFYDYQDRVVKTQRTKKLKIESQPKAVARKIWTYLHQKPNSRAWCPPCIKDHFDEITRTSGTVSSKSVQSLEDRVLKLVKGAKTMDLLTMSNALDCSPKRVEEAIDRLRTNHHVIKVDGVNVTLAGPSPHAWDSRVEIDVADRFGEKIRFGVLGDTHLGSKWCRLDALNALYDIYERENITTVYHTGNIVEGESRFNRFDIRVHGIEQQIEYCVQEYPQRDGIRTEFVTGDDHEGWWIQREGLNFGRHLEDSARKAGREDLIYLGHVEADVCLKSPGGESVMRVHHPGGGSAYAISYAAQKIVESYQGGEKPDILLLGHYHKFDYCYPREVHVIQSGCTQDQSIFMRKRKLQSMVGGVLVELILGAKGEIARCQVEWHPFFDRGFYEARFEPGK